MHYKGVVIEESLREKSILKKITILSTNVEKVTEYHNTPWLTQWTLYRVEISEEQADEIAEEISQSIETIHAAWYADFKNEKYHYIIYPKKVFKVDLANPHLYNDAKAYGISLGIPDYQVDFAPEDTLWER